MKDSVELDPVHGLNPSIIQCFYCMGDKGIALLGKIKPKVKAAFAEARLYGDGHQHGEAPRKLCLDKEPCDRCKGYMAQGIILVSVRNEDDGKENPFRTGGFVVMTEDFMRRLINDEELLDYVLKVRFVFVPDEAWEKIGLPRGPVEGVPSE